jgi:predicted TIM-barrel fold metal-dependent hydrolase
VHPAVEPFLAEIRDLVPEGASILDVHAHLGRDEDGQSLDPDGLLAQLDEVGAERACVFPLNDPERHPGYRVPNDRVLGWAAESAGRLVPFCRLDPADAPLTEAERCLARGARGIKLHPRAQAFSFDGALDPVLALAEEAGVPVLVHAGRGMPPLGDALARAALRRPDLRLVLAHAGIADQGVMASMLADHPGVFWDTSCFVAHDVIALLARVPAERLVFGSDPPYGAPLPGLYMTLRAARAAGVAEPALRVMLSGGAAALADGGPLPPARSPVGSGVVESPTPLARLHAYCAMAVAAIWVGSPVFALELVGLALSVCRDPDPGPSGPALERAARALEGAVAIAREGVAGRTARDLIVMTTALAATERA